ncbi:MAG: hypothetical protein Q9191_007811, partial [Dirinaria sp. TL-2023a]
PPAVQAYSITIENCTIALIDTPGSGRFELSEELRGWLRKTYPPFKTLYELICVVSITDHLEYEHFSSLSTLAEDDKFWLCEFTLVTTSPNRLYEGTSKFIDKKARKHFEGAVGRSKPMYASLAKQESSLTVIEKIVFGQETGLTSQKSLGIQEETLDQGRSSELVSPQIPFRRQQSMRQRTVFSENEDKGQPIQTEPSGLSRVEEPHTTEQKKQQHKSQPIQSAPGHEKPRASLDAKNDKLVEKVVPMRLDASARETEVRNQPQKDEHYHGKGKERVSSELETYNLEADATTVEEALAHEEKEETHGDDHQRTLITGEGKEERVQAESGKLVNSLIELSSLALMLLRESQKLLKLTSIHRLLRPGLQKGYSRIEWTCSCGDLMYGDFVEKSQGSLQTLAAQLGGRVISGPAAQGHPSNAPNVPTVPSQAHMTGRPAGSVSAGGVGQSSGLNQQANIVPHPSAVSSSPNTTMAQQTTRTPKWLELCIRSSPDTYVLGEVDVGGTQTDQTVFKNIKEEYIRRRSSTRLLGGFALRVPNGGVFVQPQFRKDKLVVSGSPATASIMSRPSFPKPQEAQTYKYVFDPVPMDEPPMDTRTFSHYFHKPHLADGAETWIKRFPQLADSSLFYSTEKLAKGWGIEIVEDRNWKLFVCGYTIALLLSGIIASLSSIYMHDKQTGVAIGAWLSTIETLVVTALFWHWTDI